MKIKSTFSFLYIAVVFFICSFMFQIKSFDTIKSIFDKGIVTVKKGYRWFKGDKTTPENEASHSLDESVPRDKEKGLIDTAAIVNGDIASEVEKNSSADFSNFFKKNMEKKMAALLAIEEDEKQEMEFNKMIALMKNVAKNTEYQDKMIQAYIETISKNNPLSPEEKEALLEQINKNFFNSDAHNVSKITKNILKEEFRNNKNMKKLAARVKERHNSLKAKKNNAIVQGSSFRVNEDIPLAKTSLLEKELVIANNNNAADTMKIEVVQEGIPFNDEQINKKIEQLIIPDMPQIINNKKNNNTDSEPEKSNEDKKKIESLKIFTIIDNFLDLKAEDDNRQEHRSKNSETIDTVSSKEVSLLSPIEINK